MVAGNKKRSIRAESSEENVQTHSKRGRYSEEVISKPSAPSAATTSPKRGRGSVLNSMIVWIRDPPKSRPPLKEISWVTAKITDLFKDVKVRSAIPIYADCPRQKMTFMSRPISFGLIILFISEGKKNLEGLHG
jgi:hypothetical protein